MSNSKVGSYALFGLRTVPSHYFTLFLFVGQSRNRAVARL